MRIDNIAVRRLFGHYDYELKLNLDEKISIMVGPNGSGKTTILCIINALFGESPSNLARMPFRKVIVTFDDGSLLTAIRRADKSTSKTPGNSVELCFQRSKNSKPQKFAPVPKFHPGPNSFSDELIDRFLPNLDPVETGKWRDLSTGKTLFIEDVLDEYGDFFCKAGIVERKFEFPKWYQNLQKKINVRFLDAKRLTNTIYAPQPDHMPHLHGVRPRVQSAVRKCSNDLSRIIQGKLSEYNALSQDHDRSFSERLDKLSFESACTLSSLRVNLEKIEKKHTQFIEAGLFSQDQQDPILDEISLDDIDASRKSELRLKADDFEKKLSIFDQIFGRARSLKRIINSTFINKSITIDPTGIVLHDDRGETLNLEALSSGEQHELVIWYDLLFRVPENTLVLLDEPEISLHVAWQRKFLDNLESAALASDCDVLLATHSPQIVGDRWHLTVELKGFAY